MTGLQHRAAPQLPCPGQSLCRADARGIAADLAQATERPVTSAFLRKSINQQGSSSDLFGSKQR